MSEDNRGMADFGRSMLKQVANLSKPKDEGLVDAVGATAPVQQVVAVPVARPAAPVPANDVTIISPNVQLTGTVITPDELHVAGKVHGNIAATAITIRATGVVKGDVAAETLIVHGRRHRDRRYRRRPARHRHRSRFRRRLEALAGCAG